MKQNMLMLNRWFQTINLLAVSALCCLSLPIFGASGPAIITNQPVNQIVLAESPATFTVGADGTAPLLYQWLRGGAPIGGATSASFTLSSAQLADDFAQFSVIVSNSLGVVTSAVAVLRVDPGVPGPSYGTNLITIANTSWKYDQSGQDLGTAWRAKDYNDSSWPSGFGLLGYETSPTVYAPFTFNTTLTPQASGGPITAYFRARFNYNGDPAYATLVTSNLIDDGAVFYLNGQYAGQLRVSAAPNHTFAGGADGTKDPEGVLWEVVNLPVTNLVRGENVLAVEVKQSGTASSDIVVGIELYGTVASRVRDTAAPMITRILPTPGLAVTKLFSVELLFNEMVTNVNASDLLINGIPASSVDYQYPSSYVFEFSQPPTGTVEITWAPDHGITDTSVAGNALVPQNWNYLLDPNAAIAPLFISEFMAVNRSSSTNAIRDEDGDYSDWIEIWNAGVDTANLDGWYLTDDPANLTKWQFPATSLAANRYLVVFASGKNRTSLNGKLHANFNLASEGDYLALVNPLTNVVMQFAPTYPPQTSIASYGLVTGTTNTMGYFQTPTPGAANSSAGAGFSSEIQFSRSAGTFVTNFTVTLSTKDPNAVIRYVTGNSQVTASSPIYTGPIPVNNTTLVRARAFTPGLLPGPQRSEAYLKLDSTVINRTSDLPMVVLHDYGYGDPPQTKVEVFVICQVFMPKNGVASMTNAPDLAFQGVFKRRGSSTVGQAKANLGVEAQDEFGNDIAVPFVGLPEESDWVLYAPNNFDRVQIHNPVAHQIYREMGYYSSRSKMVEMYLQDDAGSVGPIREADYNGIYVVLERIKIDDNRLNIGKVQAEETNTPAITGGYLMSVDRVATGESQFTAGNQALNYIDPDYTEMVSATFAPQRTYLVNYFNSFYAALTGANWRDPVLGYAAYIDPVAWVDYHIQNVVTFNIDGLRLSGYLHKEKFDPEVRGSGKIKWGPQWDYDRTQGSADGRDFNPRLWRSTAGDLGTDFFNSASIFANPWYSRLFNDIDFWQLWIDRYQMWRDSVLSNTNMFNMVDYWADQIRNAHPRDAAKWTGYAPRSGSQSGSGYSYTFPTPGTFQGEVTWMKFWYSNRLDFIDSQTLRRPQLSRAGGNITPGTTVTLTGPAGGTIYYTLDGTDPRAPGGVNASGVLTYTGPISINANAKLVARTYNASHNNLTGTGNPPLSSKWSGPTLATYVVATPQLAITEIMYNGNKPAGNTNDSEQFEFIELKNISPSAINLRGYRFTNGIDYIFPSNAPVLAPGAYVIVAKNPAAFSAKYPGVSNVVGGYYGFLSNGGERLALEGPLGEPMANFSFSDGWFRMANGNDFSIVLANEQTPFEAYTNAASWRLSALEGGSPGMADPAPAVISPVYINEVLAFPPAGQLDAIELFNPNAFAVNIGDWYLSDDFGSPKKYRIPAGTTIPANGYLVFTEAHFNAPGLPGGFALGARGDDAYLFSGNANGQLTGYYHGFDFGAAPQGVSFGRLVTSVGDDKFFIQSTPTLGTNNAGPAASSVVITEVMYYPPNLIEGTNVFANYVDEFIELHNPTAFPAPLYDPAAPTNTYRLRDAVQFTFPPNVVVPPGGFLIVVPFDPVNEPESLANFRARFGITGDVTILGPWSGHLDNAGESVELVQPGVPDLLTGTGLYAVPEILVDKLAYLNTTPWPCGSDGTGNSLQRLQPSQFGNEPGNWVADVPTPGTATIPKPAGLPTIINQPVVQVIPVGGNASFSVGACGLPPFYYQWKFNGVDIPNATSATLAINNAQLSETGPYTVAVSNAAGVTVSLPAQLYVQTTPTISQHPQSKTVLGYTSTSFTVTPAGTPPFQYQWRFDGANLPGATNQTLALNNVQGSQAGLYSVLVYNTAGSVLSASAQLTINLPAKIWTQPEDIRVTNNTPATFTVGANGHGTLTYQWFFNGVAMPSATNSSLVISNFTLADEGYYTVTTSNLYGADVSQPAFGKWLLVPVFVTTPAPYTIARFGTDVTYSFEVNASQPWRARWLSGAITLPGYDYDRNANPLVLTNVHLGHAGLYRVSVTNELRLGGVSATPSSFLTVVVPPQNISVVQGATAILRARVQGASPTSQTYQWRRNGTNITGATATNLVLNNIQPEQAGEYVFWVRAGSAASGYISNDYPATVTVQTTGTAPEIVTSPTNRVALTNLHTVFEAQATGTEPLAFQWYFDGTNALADATNHWLVLTGLNLSQSGNYQLVVSNAFGMATSTPALLQVAELPGVAPQLATRYVRDGGSFTLSPAISGTPPFTYQWLFNGQPIDGATAAQYSVETASISEAGTYELVVNNVIGAATGLAINVLVLNPPVITQSPASVGTNAGAVVVLAAGVSGSQPLGFQWYFNNTAIPGATNLTYRIASLTPQVAGNYYLQATNPVGLAASSAANVTIGGAGADTDGDGLPDDWESANGLLPNNPNDASLDSDGDGLTNLQEFIAGTNPQDPASALKLEVAPAPMGAPPSLLFNAVSNKSYTVIFSETLGSNSWQRLFDVTPASTNRQINIPNPGTGKQFIRIQTP